MKNTVKKYIGIVLILIIVLSCFSGCGNSMFHIHLFKQKIDETRHFKECSCGQIKSSEEHTFAWRKDYTHKECTECVYMIKERTPFNLEKNEDGTIKLRDELIISLSDYFKNYFSRCDLGSVSFEQKINRCKDSYNPLLVKFSSECYYVAAYFAVPEGHTEGYCCYNEYTWVGFEKAEDVKESWEGKALIGAFQINPQEFCVNIKTDSSDVVMEHFTFYEPEFVDGDALKPEISFDNLFVYITQSTEKYICYSSSNRSLHKLASFYCVEFEGKYYIRVGYSRAENDLGEYYEQLSKIWLSLDVTPSADYMFLKIEDVAEIIR